MPKCLDNKTYHRTENQPPALGVEYQPDEPSLTEQYFKKWACRCVILCR